MTSRSTAFVRRGCTSPVDLARQSGLGHYAYTTIGHHPQWADDDHVEDDGHVDDERHLDDDAADDDVVGGGASHKERPLNISHKSLVASGVLLTNRANCRGLAFCLFGFTLYEWPTIRPVATVIASPDRQEAGGWVWGRSPWTLQARSKNIVVAVWTEAVG